MLKATNLTVNIGSTILLDRVFIQAEPGKVTALLGPNGAGKSTLFKALCGEVIPASGEVSMAGQPLRAWSSAEQAKMRAILPQESALSFPFTALEVVLMGRTPHNNDGYESKRDYAIAQMALETVEAAHLDSRLYPTLSGGERQRVQLARVLAQVWEVPTHGNRYLLLDEPTNNLDLAHQHRILQIVRRFAYDRVAVLVVLHDLNLAAQYADEIVLLKQGRVLAKGQATATLTPALIHTAFGMPVMVIPHPCLTCPLIVPATLQPIINN